MHKKQIISFLCICILLVGMIPMFGCSKKDLYRVEYSNKGAFINAKDRYAAGETVTLRTYIVMDASPTVTVDGERLSPRVDGYEYLVYTFVMPAHDVKVDFTLGGSDMMADSHEITYPNGTFGLVDPVYSAFPGETVTLKLHPVYDKIASVYANGTEVLQTDGPDSELLYFSFVMPAEDVRIEIRSDNIGSQDPVMYADYYETVTGIDTDGGEGPGYYELVLYADGRNTLLLEEYRDGGTSREKVTRYRVPKTVYSEVAELFYTNRMETWNDLEDTYPIDGKYCVIRYVEDGYEYCVTTESMPEGGEKVFSAMRALLSAYLTDANRE